MRWVTLVAAALAANLYLTSPCSSAVTATFNLLQGQNQAGRKPSAPTPSSGDWLIGTADDQALAATYNPAGAWSHNLADLTGVPNGSYNMAPSLTGSLTLQLAPATSGDWNVSVTNLRYSGQATPFMFMNQFLVTPGSTAAQTPAYGVDGVGNSGTWRPSDTQNWAIEYELDFHFASNADGDVPIDPNDVDVAFNNKTQRGYLLPVSLLTSSGLSALTLDDPAGQFSGNFKDYLANVVAPALPTNATYLLLTQMTKTAPTYAELGMPITTNGLIGNTTIAYTTASLPEPGVISSLATMAALLLASRRKRTTG